MQPFDKGDSDAVDASWQSLLVLDTGGAEAVAPHGDQSLHGLVGPSSGAEASAGHTSTLSFEGVPISSLDARSAVGQQVTLQGSDFKATGQEAGEWKALSTGGLDRGRTAERAPEQWRERRNTGVHLKPSAAVFGGDELFSTQLERFLSLLVQADSRLLGSSVGRRIQLVDSRLTMNLRLGSWAEAVYGKLTAILQQRDPWELRLRNVEEFAAGNGRLPRHGVTDVHERALGVWLYNRGVQMSKGHMRADRLQSLLNSSSLLVRQRAEGWLSKDPDCAFKRGCLQLKHYIQQNGKLPFRTRQTSHSHDNALALWLNVQKNNGRLNNPGRRAMLESVHPMVAQVVAEWDVRPPMVKLGPWQAWLHKLVQFTQDESRLPRYCLNRSERGLYAWLNRQLHRLGQLPNELVEQLRKSHPLIAAAVESRSAQKKAA